MSEEHAAVVGVLRPFRTVQNAIYKAEDLHVSKNRKPRCVILEELFVMRSVLGPETRYRLFGCDGKLDGILSWAIVDTELPDFLSGQRWQRKASQSKGTIFEG